MKILITFLLLITIKYNLISQTYDIIDIEPGAREKAIANSTVSIGDNANTLFYNPAGLGNLKYLQISLNYFSLFSELSYNAFAISIPLSKGSFGLGLNSLSVKPFNEIIYGKQTSTVLEFNNLIFNLGYGIKIYNKYSFGLTLKYLNSKIANISRNTLIFDAGIIIGDEFLKPYKKVENNFKLGINLKNFGNNIKFIQKEDKLPTRLDIGLFYKPATFLAFTTELDNYIYKELFKDNFFKIGLELFPDYFVTFRAGLNLSPDKTLFNFGMGIGTQLFNLKSKLDIAYSTHPDLGNSLYLTLNLFKPEPVIYREKGIIRIKDSPSLFYKNKLFLSKSILKEPLSLNIEDLTESNELKDISNNFKESLIESLKNSGQIEISDSPAAIFKYSIEKINNDYITHLYIINNIEKLTLKKYKIKITDITNISPTTDKFVNLFIKNYLKDFYTQLKILSNPSGLKVYLNDKFVGTTPLTLENILIGDYEIKIEKNKDSFIKEKFKVKSKAENKFYHNFTETPQIPKIYNLLLKLKYSSDNLSEISKVFEILFNEKADYFKNFIKVQSDNYHLIVDANFSEYGNNYKLSIIVSDIIKKRFEFIKKEYVIKNDSEIPKIIDEILNSIVSYVYEMQKKSPVVENYGSLYATSFPAGMIYILNKNQNFVAPFSLNNLTPDEYELQIFSESDILYSDKIIVMENSTNYFNIIDYYYDDFSKLRKNFWQEIYYNVTNTNINVKRVKLQDSYFLKLHSDLSPSEKESLNIDKIRFGLISYEFIQTPLEIQIKFKAPKYKNSGFYFGFTDNNNQKIFIKFIEKGYLFYKNIEENEEISVKYITPFKDESEVFHNLKIVYDGEYATGYVDDIKIDQIKFTAGKKIKFLIIAESTNGKTEFYFKDFKIKRKRIRNL